MALYSKLLIGFGAQLKQLQFRDLPARRPGVASPFEGKTILVVDDDPDIVVAIRAALEDAGATVCTAADGDDAVSVAEEQLPAVVVLDAMLPKRSGFLVMDRLKSSQSDCNARVVMITGNGGKRHQAWAESRGVDGYLEKPFRMERLVEACEKLLDS